MWLAPQWRGVREVAPFPLRLDPSQTTNVHALFRAKFSMPTPDGITFRVLGAHWFRLWLDGQLLADGPARFHPDWPEYESVHIGLDAGEHVLTAHVLHEGVRTRLMMGDIIPPFFAASADIDGPPIEMSWKCLRLDAYSQMAPRRSSLLGWSEQCDMRKLTSGDDGWHEPVDAGFSLDSATELQLPFQQFHTKAHEASASGWLDACYSDYDIDVAVGFLRRRQDASLKDANGRWWRFDLGHVMLGYVRLRIRCAPGAVVETGIAETLLHGRVFPWCYYSEGPTCFVNRYIVGADRLIEWHTPMGGRHVEVHAQMLSGVMPELISFEFVQRSFFPTELPVSFLCGDEVLNRVWQACRTTIVSCTEDALVDPVRERGQWTGDNMTVGVEALATLAGDLRLVEHNARQIAQCAREDGLVAALCPGTVLHFTSYALHWQHAIWRMSELGSSKEFIANLLPAMRRNLQVFDNAFGHDGLDPKLGETFIDWGYCPASGLPDLATVALLRRATRSTVKLDPEDPRAPELLDRVDAFARGFAMENPERLGYHVTALFLAEQLIPPSHTLAATEYLKRHISDCFPMNPAAPRLRSPAEHNPRLITPYFFQFALPVLIDAGEEDFALDVMRRCWGWGIDRGMSTVPEVFSDGWSQCHVWSCAPGWLLPRYGLGLHPSGDATFNFSLPLLGIQGAEGTVPIPGSVKSVHVAWETTGGALHYRIKTPVAITIHDTSGKLPHRLQQVESTAAWRINITQQPGEQS